MADRASDCVVCVDSTLALSRILFCHGSVLLLVRHGNKSGIMKTRVEIRVIVLALAVVSTLVWLFYFVRFRVTEWSLFWLPLAPGACVGMTIYVDWDADNNILQVEELAGLRYEFKRV